MLAVVVFHQRLQWFAARAVAAAAHCMLAAGVAVAYLLLHPRLEGAALALQLVY
jgi:hypothetical protein